jgi:hypothetical protein
MIIGKTVVKNFLEIDKSNRIKTTQKWVAGKA